MTDIVELREPPRAALKITHWRIFRRYWLSILVTMALILASSGLWLFQPYLLGLAIDGLVAHEWVGVAYLAGLQVAVLIIGGYRRYYDTRVYTRIYRDIGAETVAAAQAVGLGITRTAARANMLREVVSFFEFRIPGILRASIDLVGSLGLLAFLSWNVFLASLGAMAGIVLVSFTFGGRMVRLNKGYNDQLEKEIEIYQSHSPERTREHLSRLASWQVRQSDTQVAVFGLSSLVLMFVVLYALYDTVSVKEAAIGTVFAVVTYVRRFQMAVFEFPYAYQQVIRTLEIIRRINEIEEEAPVDAAPPAAPDKKAATAIRMLGDLSLRRRGP